MWAHVTRAGDILRPRGWGRGGFMAAAQKAVPAVCPGSALLVREMVRIMVVFWARPQGFVTSLERMGIYELSQSVPSCSPRVDVRCY